MKYLFLILCASFVGCVQDRQSSDTTMVVDTTTVVTPYVTDTPAIVTTDTVVTYSEPTNVVTTPAPSYNYSSTKYFFVVLKVVEDHYTEYQTSYVTSDILEAQSYELDEETKYKLLDKFVKSYKNSPSGMAWKGNIKSRKIYSYDSYEEASRAREKYIMD